MLGGVVTFFFPLSTLQLQYKGFPKHNQVYSLCFSKYFKVFHCYYKGNPI